MLPTWDSGMNARVEKAVTVGIEETIRADMVIFYHDELKNPLLDE